MTPERIKAIRAALGENTKTFGQRFLRSGRAVEEWEQGCREDISLAMDGGPDDHTMADLRRRLP